MASGRKLWESPVVQHRLQVGGHALVCGSISATARRFAHDRKTVRDCLRRYEEYLKTGDLSVFLNGPRGSSHRTAEAVEQAVVSYYQEEDTQRTCPNIARVLQEEQQVKVTRQTVYNILRRRGVWVPPPHRGPPLIRFQMPVPNELWQADLIELEETCLGQVFALVAIDDHSRFLTALRFFFTKDQEGVLYALFLAFCEYGLPLRFLVDRGAQFYAAEEGAQSRFQEIMSALGIEVEFTSCPETKGKVEKINSDAQHPLSSSATS
jgi:transposase